MTLNSVGKLIWDVFICTLLSLIFCLFSEKKERGKEGVGKDSNYSAIRNNVRKLNLNANVADVDKDKA